MLKQSPRMTYCPIPAHYLPTTPVHLAIVYAAHTMPQHAPLTANTPAWAHAATILPRHQHANPPSINSPCEVWEVVGKKSKKGEQFLSRKSEKEAAKKEKGTREREKKENEKKEKRERKERNKARTTHARIFCM